MKNIEFDRKSQFRIGKDKIIERNHFYSMTDLCMESGIYFKDKWSSPDGKWELRIRTLSVWIPNSINKFIGSYGWMR